MKTTTLKWPLMALVAVSMCFSCKKEDNKPTGCELNMANVAGAYKVSAMQYTAGPNETPVDFMKYMEACEKDNITTFGSNGNYTYKDMGTVCEEPTDDEGTWKLDGKKIVVDGELKGTISSFDCKTLVFYIDNAFEAGDKMTVTYVKTN